MANIKVKGHLSFIYGTLKKGQPNHDLMINASNGSAVYLGRGKTTNKYPLVVAADYNVPFLLKDPGKGHEIFGELYDVDEAMLHFLDDFEGHPNLYRREPITIMLVEDDKGQMLSSSDCFQCSVYFLSEVKEDYLQLKMIEDYSADSKDCPPYVTRYHRPVPLRALVFPSKENH